MEAQSYAVGELRRLPGPVTQVYIFCPALLAAGLKN